MNRPRPASVSRCLTASEYSQFRARPLLLAVMCAPLVLPVSAFAQEQTNTPAAATEEKPPALTVPVTPDTNAPAEPAPPVDQGESAPATPETPATPPAPGDTVIAPEGAPGEGVPSGGVVGDEENYDGRTIANVRVVGARIVSDQTILLQATASRSGGTFSAEGVNADRARIDALGFFASVQAQVTPNLEDTQKVDVTFIVAENRLVSGFRFEGNVNVPSADLTKVLESKTGTVLNRNTVNSDVEKIQALYRDKGFVVLVGQTRQLDDGTLVFTLQEAKVGRIDITGQKKTRPSLIRKQIRVKAGETFDQTKIRKDLNRIYDMGFFDDVSYKIADDPNNPAQAIITYVVKEKRTGQLSLGAGFDNRSKITGFASVVESNFKGSGKTVSGSIELGGRRTFELGFADPFIGKYNAGYDLSLFRRTVFRTPRSVEIIIGGNPKDKNLNYEERRTGLRFNYTQPLDDDRVTSVLFGLRREDAKLFLTDNRNNTIPINLPIASSGTVFAPSIGLLHDKRDSRINPSRGGREQITLEQGLSFLGGSNSFTKLDLDVRRYIPLIRGAKVDDPPRLVLANRFVAGKTFGNLPVFEQYFIGGTETVRGYDNDEAYGDNQIYNNLELRYRFNKQFQFVTFVDAGSASGGRFASKKNNTLFSVGVGVRVNTPIGPLRLDIGKGREGVKTHFGIGPTF